MQVANNLVATRENNSSFGYIDFLCDIDAVNLYYMIKSGKNISSAFEDYYSDENKKRFTLFLQNGFNGNVTELQNRCQELLLGTSLVILAARNFLTSKYGSYGGYESFSYNEACAKAVITSFISILTDKINEEKD